MARRKKGEAISGWICLDKPYDFGSTQAVGKVRWLFKAQKAGHAGTLDPLRWDSYVKLKGEQAVRGMKDWQKRRHDRKFARVVDESLKRKKKTLP